MSSKKRKKSGGFFNRPDSFGNRSSQQTYSGRDSSRGYFICDNCGSNVPGMGGGIPTCPRCMIPMQPMEGQNPNARYQHNSQKTNYDYGSRIFYQTDGHPQYIGLPLGHPDPEDDHAVQAYHARRDADRKDKIRSRPMNDNRKFRPSPPYRNRNPQQPYTHQQNSHNMHKQGGSPYPQRSPQHQHRSADVNVPQSNVHSGTPSDLGKPIQTPIPMETPIPKPQVIPPSQPVARQIEAPLPLVKDSLIIIAPETHSIPANAPPTSEKFRTASAKKPIRRRAPVKSAAKPEIAETLLAKPSVETVKPAEVSEEKTTKVIRPKRRIAPRKEPANPSV